MDIDAVNEATDDQPAASMAGTADAATPSVNEHLSYPSASSDSPEPSASSTPQPRRVLKDRLYVGNLHPSVDEYTLLQVFSKFGKITKLDFLFHKTGALKGKPRGYAFVEYGNQDDALRALTKAHDKLLRGRKLVVTYAHQAPLDQAFAGPSSSLKHRKGVMEAGRPTTLSMIKSGMSDRHHTRTADKIAMMEAKLRQLESSNPKPLLSEATSTSRPAPLHPSLPAKPPPPLNKIPPNHAGPMSTAAQEQQKKTHAPKHRMPLPSLPIAPPTHDSIQAQSVHASLLSSSLQPRSNHTRAKLTGVRIVKSKEKQT
ncbi:hypothetical protein AX17_004323 [Amanita inopinata Kibby_2008]|nr:hypothetical protein AX17_004323 [Amanita inopinata Kibby_2008]